MKGGKLANPERLNIYRNSTIFTTSEHEVLTFNYMYLTSQDWQLYTYMYELNVLMVLCE